MAVSGCRAQVPPAGMPTHAVAGMTPEMQRRIEVLIRQKAQLPFTYDVAVAGRDEERQAARV